MSKIFSRIRRHLANPNSHHRRIATGFVWVSLFVFIGKLAGAAKEMAIAWRYGVSETVDAYVLIFNLINWPVSVWFSILTVVLVPLVARLRHDDPKELPRFRAELLGLTLLLGLGLGAFAYFGLSAALSWGWTGLSGKALQEALKMTPGLALMAPFGLAIGLFSVWMMACGYHRNTLLEAVPAIVILIALLAPPSWLPEPLVWGTVTGLALQTVALAWFLRRSGELQAPLLGFHSPAWRGFWSILGIMSLGQFLTSFTTVVDQLFAADLGTGALSTLSYANRLLALMLSIGATAIARATLPIFSEAQASRFDGIVPLARLWSRWMFLMGVVAAVLAAIVAPMVVELLFQRGSFTEQNTRSVAVIFRYALIQTPFYFAALVLVSALASAKRYSMIALSGAMNLLFKLLFAFLLVKSMGLLGLVASTVLMYVLSACFLYFSVGSNRVGFLK